MHYLTSCLLEDYEKASPVPPHPPKTSTTESTQSGYLSATSGSQFSNLASAGIGGSVKFRKSKGKRKATDACKSHLPLEGVKLRLMYDI